MKSYRLSASAKQDLKNIYKHTARQFGCRQAEIYRSTLQSLFESIAINPQIARLRTEFDPPVRVHPTGAHVIIYTLEVGRSPLILRIRHAHEDWCTADDTAGTLI